MARLLTASAAIARAGKKVGRQQRPELSELWTTLRPCADACPLRARLTGLAIHFPDEFHRAKRQ
jgi:hypothetical protein